MKPLSTMLNRNARALSKKEPTFAPQFDAARRLLNSAMIGNGGLVWASGAVCGPEGCTCGNPACLHRPAYRIFIGK